MCPVSGRGLGGGHYIATAKNSATGAWNLFDDSSVRAATPPAADQQQAYVLIYQRRNTLG
jgi:ubiquitin C-terminal hydrolase